MDLKEKIKVLFERRKRTNYHNKYKPSAPKYIIMIVIFMCIRFIPVTSGSSIIDDALNDLAVGATASVVVTWMLDSADCMKKNKAREEKERMIFAPHTSELLNLGFYVSSKAIQLGDEIDAKSFLIGCLRSQILLFTRKHQKVASRKYMKKSVTV